MLIDGTLNQSKYVDVLDNYVLSFKNKYHAGGNEFLYQYDGCGPHRAKKVSAFLDTNRVEVLPWPSQSPDLNPIEHDWSVMKRRLRLLKNYLTIREKLLKILCLIWDELPETYYKNLVLSMSSRCTAINKR